jgi:hypothetical protein
MKLGRDAACLAVRRRRGCTVAVRIEHESRIGFASATCGVFCRRTLDLGQELGLRLFEVNASSILASEYITTCYELCIDL